MELFTVDSLEELSLPAEALMKLLKHRSVVAFYGEMGVGKTTFIKVICQYLGVKGNVSSPTFAIVNEYSDRNQQSLYHMDLYRFKHSDELINIGAEEYFYSGNICLIEWPEKAEELLPDERINVWMEESGDGRRVIKLEAV
ncbi:MAG TPA: tRNA (adenosine(37)-N6)-threonylcarbamoyltransferase complex ATPase subunit type 1 TsaE [Marinilabiliaceae bacterium]|nr:tRNA (adenosine(37)-N6)-threonylcarbamoyltransferase complex ATPase subunit type 1 TsaE [Marinilabiliaceae bacterium]